MSRGSQVWTPGLASRLGVPHDLALVYEYVNSVDFRSFTYRGARNVGGDELATGAGLRSWLVGRDLAGSSASISAADLATARTLRSALRGLIAAHAGVGSPAEPVVSIGVSSRLPLEVIARPEGSLGLQPRAQGPRAGLSAVLIQAVAASHTGTWSRLKMCAAEDCQWVFFDRSKPRSARWCETDICGNRVKKANQRVRRAARP